MNRPGAVLAGSIVGSVLASLCCIGPLLLAVAGLGGGAVLLAFAPYRPYFLGGTALMLGGAFYLTYRTRPEDCTGDECERPANRKNQKVALWIVTVLVLLTASAPYWIELLF